MTNYRIGLTTSRATFNFRETIRHHDRITLDSGRNGFRSSLPLRIVHENKSEDHWDHPIYSSERVKEKKSVFLAHASKIHSSSALPYILAHLTSLPVLKKATHCMYAYRIIPDPLRPSVKTIGQNDGGEKGSGERLSRLLEALDCENVIVVVSRWYGGVKLGSDRWKFISSVAKEALYAGELVKKKEKADNVPSTPKAQTKKKKKK